VCSWLHKWPTTFIGIMNPPKFPSQYCDDNAHFFVWLIYCVELELYIKILSVFPIKVDLRLNYCYVCLELSITVVSNIKYLYK